MPALLIVAFFIKTTKTGYQVKSNETTVMSVNLADDLIILLTFVNNEHFVNAVRMEKGLQVDKIWMQMLCEQEFGAKAMIRAYLHKKMKTNGGHYERCDIESAISNAELCNLLRELVSLLLENIIDNVKTLGLSCLKCITLSYFKVIKHIGSCITDMNRE